MSKHMPFGGISPGDRFSNLVAVSARMTERNAAGHRRSQWLCRCDCGSETVVTTGNLKSGHTRSCGCIKAEAISRAHKTHGLVKSAEFRAWSEMRTRCFNKKRPAFKHYGGRGIAVCERWANSFVAFYEDMGPKPSPQHSLDRENNDGNYEPGNCRWATGVEQVRNRRVSVRLTDEQILSIRTDQRVARVIAAEFGIDRHYVSMIKTGRVRSDAR